MTEYRIQPTQTIGLGSEPPQIEWTLVRGDTAAFRVHVTDNSKTPLDLDGWTFAMDFYRPSTDTIVLSTTPSITNDDILGSFTVALGASQSELLQTEDQFDIQISNDETVWTVGKGSVIVIEDITN